MEHERLPREPMKLLGTILRPFRGRLMIFFVLAGLGSICFAAAPFAIRLLINELSDTRTVTTAAWWFVGMFAALRLGDEILWRISDGWVRTFLPSLREGVRRMLFDGALRKPHRYFVDSSSGQLGYWVNGATQMVSDLCESTFWSVWPQTVAFVSAVVLLFVASPAMAAIFAFWFLSLMVVVMIRGRTQAGMVADESEATSVATGRVVDVMANNLAVRVFANRDGEVRQLRRQQDKIERLWQRWWWYGLISNAIKGGSAAVVSSLSLVAVMLLYSRGEIGLGDIALFISYLTSASERIWALSFELNRYFRNYGTYKNAVVNLFKNDNERSGGVKFAARTLDISFEKLDFAYPDQVDRPVLAGVDFGVVSGKRIGIVGHSGAGKSTIVGLLLGLYEPTGGKLLFNGQEIRELKLEDVRRHVAYVPQDTSLFNRTIRENIAYGREHVRDEDIRGAAERAQALEFIEGLPRGFDSLVGERGVKLSGGQRQRIAIARAMLSEAPLVVLDEATSALDSANEQLIQKALAEVMSGRTAIVIAHRLSTLQHLEHIIVLDHGTVAEQGTHEHLLGAGGIYADLWRRQKDGFLGD